MPATALDTEDIAEGAKKKKKKNPGKNLYPHKAYILARRDTLRKQKINLKYTIFQLDKYYEGK